MQFQRLKSHMLYINRLKYTFAILSKLTKATFNKSCYRYGNFKFTPKIFKKNITIISNSLCGVHICTKLRKKIFNKKSKFCYRYGNFKFTTKIFKNYNNYIK